MRVGDLVQFRGPLHDSRDGCAPFGIVIEKRSGNSRGLDFLIEWSIHPGQPYWYPSRDLELVASTRENDEGRRSNSDEGVLCALQQLRR